MAQELDGLPDLWEGLQRLLARLRALFGTTREAPPLTRSQRQILASREAASDAQRSKPVQLVLSPAGSRARPKRPPPEPAPQPQAKPALPRALRRRLRDRQFLEQAIVVNELLNKPLALRRRHFSKP